VRKILILFITLTLFSCQKEKERTITVFGTTPDSISNDFDLADIAESGELIAATLSGPDTYFEYRDKGFGLQYSLAEDFAKSIGTTIRMEVAHDTLELISKLNKGEIDLVALPFCKNDIERLANEGIDLSNIKTLTKSTNWLISKDLTELEDTINKWYSPDILAKLQRNEERIAKQSRSVVRRARPAMLNSAKGQISHYDQYLQKYASIVGWDWRLLAAQCYQESAFDPHAISWAGAQGLMQIMPKTAAHLGLSRSDVFNPEKSIEAGARYLQIINRKFQDIRNSRERINFILAAYNGGVGHVRDAMALTSKHGGNPHVWRDVSVWILRLSDPKYYRDPVVQYGYMRGSETEGYVRSITNRWAQYTGIAHAVSKGSIPSPSKRNVVNGKTKSQVRTLDQFLNDSTSH